MYVQLIMIHYFLDLNVKSLDIRAVSQRVMEDLFHALAMRYEFTLPEKA